MAGTAASNPDLFDFIESLERDEKYLATTTAAPNNFNIDVPISDSSSSSITNNQDSQTVDVWQDIAEALNNWTQRILDVESRCNNKAASFRQIVEESLRRQQLNGFLDHNDLCELRHICGRVYCKQYRDILWGVLLLNVISLRIYWNSIH